MRCRTLLALLAILGACKADHTLGAVDQDSGADQMNADTTSASAALDTSAPMYADAPIGASPEVGGPADAPSSSGLDMGASGALGPVQSWTGYVENYQFPSGSDVIKFRFASDSSGQIVGQVILGNGTPPPPATDPNVGYPPGFSGGLLPQMEGFAYSMVAGNLTPNRLRFAFDNLEPWAGWCTLQTPPMDGSHGCLPNWGGSMVDNVCTLINPAGGTMVVDCGKLSLCQGNVCLCSTTGCSLRPADGGTVFFDLALSVDTASGSMDRGYDIENVHFTKDP